MNLADLFKGKEAEQALKKSALAALGFWFLAGVFLEDLLFSGVVGIACFFPSFLGFLYWPLLERKRHAGLVEAGLPLCLMGIAIELNLGVEFERGLKNAGKGKGSCAKEFRRTVFEIERHGSSVQDALRHFSERIESSLVKRAMMQLSAAFEQGHEKGAGEAVKRIASEVLARQKVEAKLFSGKMVVGSLLFIAVSAIVPALFQSFAIVGSVVLSMSFTAAQLFLIITVAFPVLDLSVLFYIRSRTPAFLRGQ